VPAAAPFITTLVTSSTLLHISLSIQTDFVNSDAVVAKVVAKVVLWTFMCIIAVMYVCVGDSRP